MQNITIFGIVVAVIIILVGLRILFRKQDDAAPSLESPLQFNADSQLPIIPRHVRHQLHQELDSKQSQAQPNAAKLSQDQSAAANTPEIAPASEDPSAAQAEASPADTTASAHAAETDIGAQASSAELAPSLAETTAVAEAQSVDVTDVMMVSDDTVKAGQDRLEVQSNADLEAKSEPVSAEYQLNPNLSAAEIKEFEEESSILDKHLHEQQRYDDQSTLANAEMIIGLNLYPNPRKALSGDKTLKVLLKYGLRFGELKCFHRYEAEDEGGGLMFSVLRISEEGPSGFDLENLSCEQVQGLAFFLALPHRNVQKGFDTMVSIAGLIAREIDGTVYDENNLEFTPQLKEHWRHKAIDYRSGQQV